MINFVTVLDYSFDLMKNRLAIVLCFFALAMSILAGDDAEYLKDLIIGGCPKASVNHCHHQTKIYDLFELLERPRADVEKMTKEPGVQFVWEEDNGSLFFYDKDHVPNFYDEMPKLRKKSQERLEKAKQIEQANLTVGQMGPLLDMAKSKLDEIGANIGRLNALLNNINTQKASEIKD